jgi:hypothetical protein
VAKRGRQMAWSRAEWGINPQRGSRAACPTIWSTESPRMHSALALQVGLFGAQVRQRCGRSLNPLSSQTPSCLITA